MGSVSFLLFFALTVTTGLMTVISRRSKKLNLNTDPLGDASAAAATGEPTKAQVAMPAAEDWKSLNARALANAMNARAEDRALDAHALAGAKALRAVQQADATLAHAQAQALDAHAVAEAKAARAYDKQMDADAVVDAMAARAQEHAMDAHAIADAKAQIARGLQPGREAPEAEKDVEASRQQAEYSQAAVQGLTALDKAAKKQDQGLTVPRYPPFGQVGPGVARPGIGQGAGATSEEVGPDQASEETRHPPWGQLGPGGIGGRPLGGLVPRFDPIGPFTGGPAEPNRDHLTMPGFTPGNFQAFHVGPTGRSRTDNL